MKRARNEIFNEVKDIFTNFLKQQEYRKTQGRYDILFEIYSIKGHFEVETLYLTLKNKNYHISRATIYNTIDLLLECGLIVKHSFGHKAGSYEKAYGNKRHDHIINLDNQDVVEFTDERVEVIAKEIAKAHSYNMTHYSFTIYGTSEKK